MLKYCECGALKRENEPAYCYRCQTFTHPVYTARHAQRVTEATAQAGAEVASEQGDEGCREKGV